MRTKRVLPCLAAALLATGVASAEPALWEADFGAVVAELTAQDDAETPVTLSFPFPFVAVDYTTVYVGTNGCLQLGGLGADDDIDYDLYWYFEEFYADDDGIGDPEPVICPLNADFDLSSTGTIHFNDFGDRAVFTWNEVGTNDAELHRSSFQAQLFADGTIVFGYNGILDGPGESTQSSLGTGIVVGISRSLGDFPTPELDPFDLNGGSFVAGDTIYQRWCGSAADSCGESGVDLGWAGQHNAAFDLDQHALVFTPVGAGFAVASPDPPQLPVGPGWWERDAWGPLHELTGGDDVAADTELSFPFPFAGSDYTTVWVGNNGCLQLGSLGNDNFIDYDLWEYFEEFYDDGAPLVCPLSTDLDLTSTGRIHFRDLGDRAVYTWDEVGTNLEELHLSSFQVILHADGSIVFTYNGILDDEDESPFDSLDEGIVVGITASDGSFPTPEANPFDFIAGADGGDTIYRRWCYLTADSCGTGGVNEGWAGETNAAFNLDKRSFVFTPTPSGYSLRMVTDIFADGFD
jgi:hypothetical protein